MQLSCLQRGVGKVQSMTLQKHTLHCRNDRFVFFLNTKHIQHVQITSAEHRPVTSGFLTNLLDGVNVQGLVSVQGHQLISMIPGESETV